jgi:hypothetical protein
MTTIAIAMHTAEKFSHFEQVPAILVCEGQIGIHEDASGWTVSHVNTGIKLLGGMTAEQALVLVGRLQARYTFADWDFDVMPKSKEELTPFVREVMDVLIAYRSEIREQADANP